MGTFEYAVNLAWLTALLIWVWKHVFQFIKENWFGYAMMLIPSYEFDLRDNDLARWLSKNVNAFRVMDWYDGTFPGPGLHFFRDKGVWMMLTVNVDTDGATICIIQTYKSAKWIRSWVKSKEEVKKAKKPTKIKVSVYSGDKFRRVPDLDIRKPETLIFKGDLHLKVLDDVNKFIDEPSKFKDYGISKSKGYCLYGPPGSGKTSIPLFVAGHVNRELIMVRPEAIAHSEFLMDMHSRAKKSIFVFDDIDALLMKRPDDSSTSGDLYQQHLHKLLSLMDSPMTPEGLIFFMTTNHLDVLDDALVRPGRVDNKYFVDYPGDEEIRKLFQVVYPEENPEEFMAALGDRRVSPAALLGHLIRQETVQKCIENISLIEDMLSTANYDDLANNSGVGYSLVEDVDFSRLIGEREESHPYDEDEAESDICY